MLMRLNWPEGLRAICGAVCRSDAAEPVAIWQGRYALTESVEMSRRLEPEFEQTYRG